MNWKGQHSSGTSTPVKHFTLAMHFNTRQALQHTSSNQDLPPNPCPTMLQRVFQDAIFTHR
jgi:hypothetical protein